MVVAVVFSISCGAAAADAPKTHQVRLNGHTFTLPVGFDIELAAAPPLVSRPISMDFDEQGRLYVTDSSGSNEPVQEQLKKKPHRVLRLEDTTGKGRFDKSTVFADQMMFPEGCLWYAGSLYVAAPPSIWKLTDTTGTGKADQREEWFKGKTLTGCANDLHGPYLGPDGWIYWGKGAFAKQTYELDFGGHFETRAAHIFRCRPDGSRLEPVMTGGMDNPVGIAFTATGELICSGTFFQFPGGGRRDGLIHVIYGGIYGKDWDVIHDKGHRWTGPEVMPIMTHLGAAAPCGLIRYESRVFGPKYQDNLFACLFNMQKVTRHVLVPKGSTFTTRDEDFLVSDNKDFHPTDVKEDADGSLLVADTGGWYKLCCPTSQLVKPDVLGAIYRIRRHGAARVNDPRGLKLAWGKMAPAGLAELLSDPRPAVQQRAIEGLADKERSVGAVSALLNVLATSPLAPARRNAVWAATRSNALGAPFVVEVALQDRNDGVRQAALHSVSLNRRLSAAKWLTFQGTPQQNRLTAEALGRMNYAAAVPDFLFAAADARDRAEEHALTYALIEITDASATARGLKSWNPRVRRITLTALDQMPKGGLHASAVLRELAAHDAALKETAWWIAARHPEWGEQVAKFLRHRLADKNLSAPEREAWAKQLGHVARAGAVQQLLAEQVGDSFATAATRRLALRAMADSRLKPIPESWIAALAEILGENNAELTGEAVTTLRSLPLPKELPAKLSAALLATGQKPQLSAQTRLGALAILPAGRELEPALFALVRDSLGSEKSVAARSTACDVLARAKLNSEQLLALADVVKSVGPMEINRLVEAFGPSPEKRVAHRLLEVLRNSSARSALRRESLRATFAKATPVLRQQAEELFASLNADTPMQAVHLQELLTSTHGGDVRRGQAVFNSTKAACCSCHAIGYLGGNIGPDLTHIARIRTDRDLLEAIVYPSASFVRGYEPVVVATRDGKTYNGVIRRDAADELVLAVGANQEVRLARADIEDVQPSRVSVMPAGLEQQLTRAELADLLAFLKACK
jgi:putative membrane-bound dehydrogenase-like protein